MWEELALGSDYGIGFKRLLRSARLSGIKVPAVPMVRQVKQGEEAADDWFPERNR